MARVLERFGISNYVTRIGETVKGYILDGHYYRKDTLSPIPLKVFPIEAYHARAFLSKRTFITDTLPHIGNMPKDMIVRDNQDPSITYILFNRSNEIGFKKIRETDDTAELLARDFRSTASLVGSYHGSAIPMEILGQNDRYIFFSCSWWYNRSNNNQTFSGIFTIDKHLNTLGYVRSFGFHTLPSKIYETDTHIYIAGQRNNHQNWLGRWNKDTFAWEGITVQGRAGEFQGLIKFTEGQVVDPLNEPDHIVFYGMNWDNTNDIYYFVRYKLDLSSSDLTTMAVEEEFPVIWKEDIADKIPKMPQMDKWVRNDLFISDIDGVKYLNLARYNGGNANYGSNIPHQGIYTFIIRDTTLELTNFVNFSIGADTKGWLVSNDKTFLVAGTLQNVVFFNFDTGIGGYKETEIIDMIPNSIGLDQSDNVWVVKRNNEVEMISLAIPTEVNVEFASTNYKYEGIDINTTISIEAKNYQGENIEVTLDLIIDGNAVFTSGETKITREVTSTTGLTHIPITITGHGNITIYPKFITRTI